MAHPESLSASLLPLMHPISTHYLMYAHTFDAAIIVGHCSQDVVLTGSENSSIVVDGNVPESFVLATGFVFVQGIVNTLADIRAVSVQTVTPIASSHSRESGNDEGGGGDGQQECTLFTSLASAAWHHRN
jgi:hypothetical protein